MWTDVRAFSSVVCINGDIVWVSVVPGIIVITIWVAPSVVAYTIVTMAMIMRVL